MGSNESVLALIELIYEAAGDPAKWVALLERLAGLTKAAVGTIHYQDGASQESNFSDLWNLDTGSVVPYTTYYGFRNPLMTTRPAVIRAGAVNTLQMLCPEDAFVRSEYYNDYLHHLGLLQCLAATLRNDGADSSNLSLFRETHGEPFGEEERKLLLILMPHLQRAFQLHTRIQGLERKAEAAEETLNELDHAVVMLGGRGTVLLVNDAARTLAASESALKLTPCGLMATAPSEDRKLRRLIQGALSTGRGAGVDAGGPITISREGLRQPLHVFVTPLRTQTLRLGKETPVVAIFISDPERKPAKRSSVFAQLYGLTRAEARLAESLADGKGLKETSEQLGVAQSTLRSQLKSVFAKTNTNRQGQLIRLILLTPATRHEDWGKDGNVLR
jgi:DNA-binding CsgD family transcriptional regulator